MRHFIGLLLFVYVMPVFATDFFCYGAGVSERRGYVSTVVLSDLPGYVVADYMKAYLRRRDVIVPVVRCVSANPGGPDIFRLRALYLRELSNSGASIVDVPNFVNQGE